MFSELFEELVAEKISDKYWDRFLKRIILPTCERLHTRVQKERENCKIFCPIIADDMEKAVEKVNTDEEEWDMIDEDEFSVHSVSSEGPVVTEVKIINESESGGIWKVIFTSSIL